MKVIQWNYHGIRLNFDELMCLQETFLKNTDNITVRGFNCYHKFEETEGRVSGSIFIFVNENTP